jgi:hypothetical protein
MGEIVLGKNIHARPELPRAARFHTFCPLSSDCPHFPSSTRFTDDFLPSLSLSPTPRLQNVVQGSLRNPTTLSEIIYNHVMTSFTLFLLTLS